jgi:hypothetical protein
MSTRPRGSHVYIDTENPQAVGICDYTGFIHQRDELVKQMEWRGESLEWTGLYVGKEYADVPNEQLRPPILPPDPVPISDAKLEQDTLSTGYVPPIIPVDERMRILREYKYPPPIGS